jgi:adenylosuccinate synthase
MTMNKVVLGCQLGDEGKGKITDLLAEDMDYVIRTNGGPNAGHSIVFGDKTLATHSIPSGIRYPKCINVIGNGCVIDPEKLLTEIRSFQEAGIYVTPLNLRISNHAHIITPECLEEDSGGLDHLGTTRRGIGPCYSRKAARTGIRMEDWCILSNPDTKAIELKPYIVDAREILQYALDHHKPILFEGAQGTLLDIDHGTYPYVSSSNSTIGGVFTGTGIYTRDLEIYGVVKAYTTRIGTGPLKTELNKELGDKLRELGHEYGATTGRPRRCGWLNLEEVRQAIQINGIEKIALTKIDCLDSLEEIKVYVGNEEYKTFRGWQHNNRGKTSLRNLSSNCQDYICFIEEFLNTQIKIISTGPGRDEIIMR